MSEVKPGPPVTFSQLIRENRNSHSMWPAELSRMFGEWFNLLGSDLLTAAGPSYAEAGQNG